MVRGWGGVSWHLCLDMEIVNVMGHIFSVLDGADFVYGCMGVWGYGYMGIGDMGKWDRIY